MPDSQNDKYEFVPVRGRLRLMERILLLKNDPLYELLYIKFVNLMCE